MRAAEPILAVEEFKREGHQSRRKNSGCFTRVEGQIRFAFGTKRWEPLDAVSSEQPGYPRGMFDRGFLVSSKAVARHA